jgi:hypothetical protein
MLPIDVVIADKFAPDASSQVAYIFISSSIVKACMKL